MNDPFFNMIDSYFDGSIKSNQKQDFLAHIEACEKCKSEFLLSQKIFDTLHSMERITPPADFFSKLNDRLDLEEQILSHKRHGYNLRLTRYSSAVAACLLLTIVTQFKTGDLFVKTELPVDTTSQVDFAKTSDDGLDSLPEKTQSAPVEDNAVQSMAQQQVDSDSKSDLEAIDVDASSTFKAATPTPAAPGRLVTTPVSTTAVSPTEKATAAAPLNEIVEPAKPSATAEPTVVPAPTPSIEIQKPYMDSRSNVVLASSIEKDYQIKEIKLEDLPVKKRDLAQEFSLLENTKTGVAIANPVNLSSLSNVEVERIKDNRSKSGGDYGIGSGSLFISGENKELVSELLEKYMSDKDNSMYYLTNENFKLFVDDLEKNDIKYKKSSIIENGNNITFKVVVA